MINFILIFLFNSGIVLQRVKISTNSYKLLNKIVIYICLPALALYYIRKFIE
jgi:predicted permease